MKEFLRLSYRKTLNKPMRKTCPYSIFNLSRRKKFYIFNLITKMNNPNSKLTSEFDKSGN